MWIFMTVAEVEGELERYFLKLEFEISFKLRLQKKNESEKLKGKRQM
jgi:hypothetical protein